MSMCQVTEGALDEVTTMLQRIRTLAIESANGTNSSAEREALDQEVQQLITEVKRIGTDTTFAGNLKVLGSSMGDGTTTTGASNTVFQVGSNAYETVELKMKSMSHLVTITAALSVGLTAVNTLNIGTSLSDMNVTSASEAQDAIAFTAECIKRVDSYRAEMGAVQNRLESTISNQENIIENVNDARARIRDVDYASETAAMTQQNIIQQASTTILTQANQKTQIALNLLQG